MGRRVKELERALSQKETELSSLRQQAAELGAAVERYRMQESAIAGALTKAQSTAEGIIQEAEEEKAAMLRLAAQDKREAETEARGIVQDAQNRAALIEGEAKSNARQTAARAEGFMESYRASAQKLVAEFRRTAAMAAGQAERFADSMNALELDQAVEITREYDHVAAMHETPAQDMPDDYVDPASLMRSIYAIEQRDLPDIQSESASAPAFEAEAQAVPELEPELEPEPEQEAGWEPEIEPEPVPEATRETENVTDPFTSWAGSLAKEEPGAPQWAKEAVSLEDRDNERMWTVEEIVERTSANGNAEIDDELNAIIEDVLRGS